MKSLIHNGLILGLFFSFSLLAQTSISQRDRSNLSFTFGTAEEDTSSHYEFDLVDPAFRVAYQIPREDIYLDLKVPYTDNLRPTHLLKINSTNEYQSEWRVRLIQMAQLKGFRLFTPLSTSESLRLVRQEFSHFELNFDRDFPLEIETPLGHKISNLPKASETSEEAFERFMLELETAIDDVKKADLALERENESLVQMETEDLKDELNALLQEIELLKQNRFPELAANVNSNPTEQVIDTARSTFDDISFGENTEEEPNSQLEGEVTHN